MHRLVLLIALAAVTTAQAQPVDDGIDRYAWLSGSVGPSLTGGAGGGTFAATAGRNDNLLTLRASVTDTGEPIQTGMGSSEPTASESATMVRDVGLLYGRSLVRGPRGAVVASAGLAYTLVDVEAVDDFGSFSLETRATVGVPFQVDAVAFPFGPLGLGLRLGGNLNGEQTTLTGQVGVYIGAAQ